MPSRDQGEEPARRLRLGRSQERILAARLLGERGTASDITALQRARDRELDHHVQRAIEQALRNAQGPTASSDASARITAPDENEAYARAFQSVSTMLVHELQNLVGFARLDIAREVLDPNRSQAARSVERIGELLDAIEELGDLTTQREAEALDLSMVIRQTCEREEVRLGSDLEPVGPRSVEVSGSPVLIDLALAKGIENAAESTADGPNAMAPIVVNWGATDRDAWFAVLDEGAGLASDIDAFAFGKSDKDDHLGVGLTLASKAIKAMSGSIRLEPNRAGGATLRANWPIV